MEKPSEAAESEGSLQPREPSPTGPPTSDQDMVETMPVLPSNPLPISATLWILDHPSTRGLSSITVPIRLDSVTFLLNQALLGASVPRSLMPLSDGQGLLVGGHGGTTPHAIGSRCQPHYCCSPQWPCANPLQPSGTQPPSVGFCGSGSMGQSSTRSQEISRGRADWQNSFPRWDQRGSALAVGIIGKQGGRKILFGPWGAGSQVASKAQTAPLQEKTTPLPPSKDGYYNYLENLFTDLPKKSSTVSDPRLERQPHEDAAERLPISKPDLIAWLEAGEDPWVPNLQASKQISITRGTSTGDETMSENEEGNPQQEGPENCRGGF
ncbi:uncharacterized protein LOC127033542 [Gopherus flavomarginatus]|uniref:uncharacterized protein LOC127033542 n=1 Tax=Gopherus flavomarginatus TaxID=286002 RepID=UPI0021CC19FE|nr:uncharacterized protein LOC127033542 [Gopherus flavomarginatus]